MRRILLECAYDGTGYHGWEAQEGQPTIEGEINRALSELCMTDIRVIGASRTDAGVHAMKNIAVFDTDMKMDGFKFANAVNARLPEDIRIMGSREVDAGFHPRKCASEKTYRYSIMNTRTEVPMKRLYSHHVYVPLDADRMNEAAQMLAGEHDFASFCSIHTQARSTVRRIISISVQRDADEISITVTGNGFLYNMVRIISGTLIEVGRGKLEPEQIHSILEEKNRNTAGPTAPAAGLTLIEVKYTGRENSIDNNID